MANYQYINSTTIIIPANTSYWGTLPVTQGSILSSGLQNGDYFAQVYPTQLFVLNSTTIFFQVDNLTNASVSIVIWAVVDNANSVGFTGIQNAGSKPIA